MLLTLDAAGERLGLSGASIRRLIASGQLAGVNVGRSKVRPRWRITEDALRTYIAVKSTVPPSTIPRRRKPHVEEQFV